MNLLVKLISLVIWVSQWAIVLHAQTDCSSPIPLTLVNDEICIDSSSLGESTTTTLYCGLNAAPANEIWFSYTVTQSQNDFTIVPGTLQDAMMVIYENGCAGTGILHCAIPVTGSNVLSYSLGFAVGTQLNIGIFSMSGNDGSFQFCIDSYSNSSANGNGCAGAIPVCEGTTVVDMSTYNSSGIQPSCFTGGAVNQDVWFQFDVLQSGTFDWSASPSGGSGGVELDWALMDITNGCPGSEVACNYNWNSAANNPCGQVAGNTTVCPLSTAGPASAEFCPPSNLIAGNTYAIVIDFYSNSSVGTLDFSILGGSAVIAPYADFAVTPNTAVCDDSLVVNITNSGLGDAMWDYGDGFTYFGSNPPDHVYNTPGIYEITSFVNGLCPSYDTAYVELIDIPVIDSILDQIVCEGDLFNTVNFTGTIGATFDWTNSNTAIGLAGLGTGDIAGFQSSPVSQVQVATIEVTPSLGACVGTPEQFSFTINPTESSVFSYVDSTLCTGDFPELAIISGAQGGTFSSSPNGLTIDNLTGEIDPSTSQVGTYTVSYTTGGQCPSTSTRTFEIIDNPTVDPILDQVVCEGDLFTAVTFTGTAGATFDWTNSNGLIGLVTSGTGDITGFQSSSVNQVLVATIEVTPSIGACVGTPEQFTFTINPTESSAFSYVDSTLCTGDFPEPAIISGTQGGTFSSSPNGLTINSLTGEIDPSTSQVGTYIVSYTTGGQCPSTSTRTFEIIDNPTVDPIVDQVVCEGDLFTAVTFTGTAGATFDWINSNTAIGLAGLGTGDIASFQSSSVNQVQVATIEVTPSIGACVGNPEQFILTINPTESSAFSYADSTLCTGDFPEPVIISGAQGGTFSSSPNGLTINSLTGEIDPSTSQVGTYTVSYTTGGLCPSVSTRTFEIIDNPTVDPILDQVVCEGDLFTAVTFAGTAGATFDWTNSNGLIGLVTSGSGNIASFQSASVNQIENGLITVTPLLGMCVGNPETFELSVIAAPDVSFEGDVLEGCEVHGVNFTNLSSGTGDCFWDFGNGLTSSDCGPVYVEYNSGIFDVSLSIEQDGCESTLLLQDYITVYQNPIAAFSATPNTISPFDSDVQFYNTSSNSDTYMWDFGDGSFDTIVESPMHLYTDENGDIVVTLWAYNSEFGCADSATLIIGQSEELIYYVPNSFTPDGDTYNEVFQPVFTEGYDPFDFHMVIFNRWGEIVFESFDANGGWNGHYMGKLVQDGTYTWKIDFKETMSDKRHSIIGHVNIIR